jgi:hypothetical protein
VGSVCREGDTLKTGLAIAAIAFSVFALWQSGFIYRPLAKADSLPLTNFAAKWQFNANRLENMSQSMPDDLRRAMLNRASSKRN